MAPEFRYFLAGLVLFCTTILAAQERHLSQKDLGSLYKRSTFVHGYIHGYEDGFHWGDLDLQMGRPPHDPDLIPDYRQAKDGFERSFGPKQMWQHGFRNGFMSGYEDALHQRSFSAISRLRRVASGLVEANKQSPIFDTAFLDGYGSGRKQGANDADSSTPDPIVPPCMQPPGEYCDAFERGFYLGYADGFAALPNPSRKLQASAEK